MVNGTWCHAGRDRPLGNGGRRPNLRLATRRRKDVRRVEGRSSPRFVTIAVLRAWGLVLGVESRRVRPSFSGPLEISDGEARQIAYTSNDPKFGAGRTTRVIAFSSNCRFLIQASAPEEIDSQVADDLRLIVGRACRDPFPSAARRSPSLSVAGGKLNQCPRPT